VKSLRLALKLLISAAFFAVLLSFVKTNELLTVFARVDWFYLGLTVLVTLVMVAASCAKWKLVLDLKGRPLPYWQLFKIYLIGYFFSNILPSTVGGDVVRFYYAGRLLENQSFAAISVFIERFSGIFLLFLLVALAPLLQPALYANPYVWVPALAGVGLAAITLWVWRANNPFAWPNRISARCFAALARRQSPLVSRFGRALERVYAALVVRLVRLKEELQHTVAAARQDRRFLARLVGWTVLFYLLTWVNVYTAFKAFGTEVSFVAVCALVPAIMLVAHVPVTLLGNLGYFESVFVFYFLLVGVGGAESLAMGLLLRLKMLGVGGLGFISYLAYRQRHQLDLAGRETGVKIP
jgi:glycosyltransferase 2 family protein